MGSYLATLRWLGLAAVTALLFWLTVSRNTLLAIGVVAGIAVGSHRAAYRTLSSTTLSTAVATLSTGLFVGAVSVALVSTRWLPTLSTATLGYAIGIVAAWLLVSGASVEELGPFAAIGGLLIAVGGGAVGLLSVPDSTLFIVMLVGGLVAGVAVPLSALVLVAVTTSSHRTAVDGDQIKPATRFGIEAAAITGLALVVPFGSRAVALFGAGGLGLFPVGVGGGLLLSVSLLSGGGESTRLRRFHDWFVQHAYRLLDRLERWVERRRERGSQQRLAESASGDSGAAAAADDGSIATASALVDQAAGRVADHEFVRMAAEELETLAATNSGLTDRVDMFWGRLGGAVERTRFASGSTLQLSAAESAHQAGDDERARSITDAALQLAAPTIGSVAAAVVRGRRSRFESLLAELAPLFSRIDSLLAEERIPDELEDPDDIGLVQRLLERIVDEETGEGFDSALSTIRAAAADGWYSVQAGDQAVTNENYQRALLAYLSAIAAYRRALDISTDAKQTATADRNAPDDSANPSTAAGRTVTAAAGTYASEATRIETALEALLYDTAAVAIAGVDDLYGDEPPPTVDTDYRRTIVRTLRVLRQTRTRIDANVPPIGVADDRYQQAELARSVARIRRHLSDADETARRGNIQAAVDQYDRAADRLDVLSNRAGSAGLAAQARSLLSTATAIGRLADEPSPERIRERPDPTLPAPDANRAPAAVPAGDRLRRSFCEPAFVELYELTTEAAAHPVLEFAGEPFPALVDAVGMALGSLDPLYSEPDVDSIQQWVAETTLAALSAAVETIAERHRALADREPPPPAAFREPPAVLDEQLVAAIPESEGVDAFADGWLSRADKLAAAGQQISRQQAAVDGFAALEATVRETLADRGWLGTSQVSAELLAVAASRLAGVEYDSERQRLSKTGEISRREPPAPDEQSTVSESADAESTAGSSTEPASALNTETDPDSSD